MSPVDRRGGGGGEFSGALLLFFPPIKNIPTTGDQGD